MRCPQIANVRIIYVKKTRQSMDIKEKQKRLADIIKEIHKKYSSKLKKLKLEYKNINREDFIWHYLLQSFATMGRASGWDGLIGNKGNYSKLKYDIIKNLSPKKREKQVIEICHQAKIRMPNKKAEYILECFIQIEKMGGLSKAKEKLNNSKGRRGKINFLKQFHGIGDKYARNIMMDVYHEEFRNSIAIDIRIKAISKALNLIFSSYNEHEIFYLEVAEKVEINGWELDRLLFHYRKEIEDKIKTKY